jgi:AraC-like DNA-binding protein
MIRRFHSLGKINFNNSSDFCSFTNSMASFRPEKQRCPHCKSNGNCIQHASYERSLVSFEGGKVVFRRLLIIRVICTSCRHTHAILPDVIIPYGSYSLSFILQLMKEYYFHHLTVEKLCDRFCISISTFYRLKHIYLSHRLLWLGITTAANEDVSDFLLFLIVQDCISDFLSEFHQLTAFSFLQQKHRAARSHLPTD